MSEASGVALAGYGMGCAVGDHDGDGTPDLYVTRVGPDALLANQGDGTFRDVTAEAGLANDGYTSSACWFDGDGDGRGAAARYQHGSVRRGNPRGDAQGEGGGARRGDA
ncbi:MAG: VCBS repeat-containing protein, partial [Myxococcota bacterium]|nr:VCBS repeat-containing protein [Myxococcota bacterium]